MNKYYFVINAQIFEVLKVMLTNSVVNFKEWGYLPIVCIRPNTIKDPTTKYTVFTSNITYLNKVLGYLPLTPEHVLHWLNHYLLVNETYDLQDFINKHLEDIIKMEMYYE